jgi:hypothetical protein
MAKLETYQKRNGPFDRQDISGNSQQFKDEADANAGWPELQLQDDLTHVLHASDHGKNLQATTTVVTVPSSHVCY